MSVHSTNLSPTPPERLTDPQGRPCFLWDCEMTVDDLRRALRDSEPAGRAYLVAKLMRQAKPDDVFSFVSVGDILKLWDRVEGRLGTARPFWSWLLGRWAEQDRGAG
jgi:hypothetical protein